MTGRHFLERVDDTPPHSIRPFIFTIKRLKTPLQVHSNKRRCLVNKLDMHVCNGMDVVQAMTRARSHWCGD
jgi:hypothetical protein